MEQEAEEDKEKKSCNQMFYEDFMGDFFEK